MLVDQDEGVGAGQLGCVRGHGRHAGEGVDVDGTGLRSLVRFDDLQLERGGPHVGRAVRTVDLDVVRAGVESIGGERLGGRFGEIRDGDDTEGRVDLVEAAEVVERCGP